MSQIPYFKVKWEDDSVLHRVIIRIKIMLVKHNTIPDTWVNANF